MSTRIPNLVFATRSPTPRGGADFVRQIVAESVGITEDVRRDFSRRADIAGSVLQRQVDDSTGPLRVFTFHRLNKTTWLFSRAVSLGIYRKGSHQLLVHGILLSEEALVELEGNPMALDAVSDSTQGFGFLDQHPGHGAQLETLTLSSDVTARARQHNRERLKSIRPGNDTWLAHAYDLVAVGGRVACVSSEPNPRHIEELLLHLHPDDRMEMSFHTFYTHSRPVDYRLLGVLREDLAGIQRQFRNLEPTDLDKPEPTRRGGLGTLACRNRREDPVKYRNLVDQVRLSYLSERHFSKIRLKDAAFALDKGWLAPDQLSQEDHHQLRHLKRRSVGGLANWIEELAGTWAQPKLFKQTLDEAEETTKKIASLELESYTHELEDDSTHLLEGRQADRRWALATLLGRDRAWVPGTIDDRGQWHMVRQLLPADALPAFIDGFTPDQAKFAKPVLRQWALADAAYGDPGSATRPTWLSFLVWLHDLDHRLGGSLSQIESVLASRPDALRLQTTWQRLRRVCRDLGCDEEAFELLINRELPLLAPDQARQVVAEEVDRVLRDQPEKLSMLASSFDKPGVAEAVFNRLADYLAGLPESAPTLVPELAQSLEAADALDRGAAKALGRLLAELALLPPTASIDVSKVLLQSSRIVEEPTLPFSREALAAAAEGLIVQERLLATMEPIAAVRAIRVVLQARGGYGPASKLDAAQMNLAVLGKTLAANLPPNHHGVGGELDRAWIDFLRLAQQSELFKHPPAAARSWISLLQQELDAEPPKAVGDEHVKLSTFLDLAWVLWSRASPNDPYRAALEFKLRWFARPQQKEAVSLSQKALNIAGGIFKDPKQKHREWHFEKIEQRVPRKHRSRAKALIAPLTFKVGDQVVDFTEGS